MAPHDGYGTTSVTCTWIVGGSGHSPNAWAVVLTHVDEGHVSDAEAASTNYDKMLKDMQDATREDNEERQKQGYGRVELVGWAAKPHYDQATNKIYWAKELKFDGSPGNTLNYDIRVLGRSGYLSLNAVAPMTALPTVDSAVSAFKRVRADMA